MSVEEDPLRKEMNCSLNIAMAAIIQFEDKIVTKLIKKCIFWLGLNHAHIYRDSKISKITF